MDTEQWQVFFELHSGLPREGPGDNESTRKAFRMLRELPKNPRVLDVGCGPGMQTIELAKLSRGRIDALDKYQQFLDDLRQKAEAEGLAENIKPVNGDMFALDYVNSSFDLIWAEGTIYIIGFENGLLEWKRLLTRKGYIVASEVSWLKLNPPEEVRKYWGMNYPAIRKVQENLETTNRVGYRIVGWFVLPEKSWWEKYYKPIQAKLPVLKEKYRGNSKALEVLATEELEIEMFRKYSDYYGYVFYVLQVEK